MPSIPSTGLNEQERPDAKPRAIGAELSPLVVRPRVARHLLGGMSGEKFWELLNAGILESFLEGRARLVTLASIEAYIARRLAGTSSKDTLVNNALAARTAKRGTPAVLSAKSPANGADAAVVTALESPQARPVSESHRVVVADRPKSRVGMMRGRRTAE
jgi:hypothetical protein